jgi:hypothetical protein
MNAKRLFEDDDLLFAPNEDSDEDGDRPSHIELKFDASEPASTQREIPAATDFFQRIPRLAVEPRDLTLLALDHREGFLVSLVDGVSTIETVLDLCAMPADEALEILESLALRGVLLIPR